MTRQQEFFRAVARRNIVRVRVAGIVISNGKILVQKPTDDSASCYAFIGGEYEIGDTFESRLRREFEEETTAMVIRSEYLFVVENRIRFEGKLLQGIEHYFDVDLDREEIKSRETPLLQYWLPLNNLRSFDVRPHIVRDVIDSGDYKNTKHLVVPLEE
jgi:ADP-ribose pyrophosphatase YjhB (NUDIX family)